MDFYCKKTVLMCDMVMQSNFDSVPVSKLVLD